MKRRVLFVVLLTISISGYSQFSIGLKAGLNYSRVTHKSDTARSSAYGFAPSFHVGGYGRVGVSEKISLGTELLISDKGFNETGSKYFGRAHLLYADIPFLVIFKIIKGVSLEVGPEVGLLITSWGKDAEYFSELYSNRLDLGMVVGLGYSITREIGITLRFEQGLSNMVGRDVGSLQYRIGGGDPLLTYQNLRDNGVVHRNQNFQLSVCYSLFTRK